MGRRRKDREERARRGAACWLALAWWRGRGGGVEVGGARRRASSGAWAEEEHGTGARVLLGTEDDGCGRRWTALGVGGAAGTRADPAGVEAKVRRG